MYFRKTNSMIFEYNSKLSFAEIKLLDYLLYALYENKHPFDTEKIIIYLPEVIQSIGYSTVSGNGYIELRKCLNKLKELDIIKSYDSNSPNTSDLSIYFNPSLIDFRNELFITLDYSYYKWMNSKYSVRLYELLKCYEDQSIVDFPIYILKQFIGASSSYDNFANFKARILDKEIIEINSYTDLIISYNIKKRKRKVMNIIFNISKKKSEKNSSELEIQYYSGDKKYKIHELFDYIKSDLIKFGFKIVEIYKIKLLTGIESEEKIINLLNHNFYSYTTISKIIRFEKIIFKGHLMGLLFFTENKSEEKIL